MPFPPTFNNLWDTTAPPDTQAANQLGLDIRNLKTDIMQRMSLLSGLVANRPTPETVNAVWGGAGFGLLYVTTDSNQIFQWNGAAWIDVSASILGPLQGLTGPSRVVASLDLSVNASIGASTLYTTPSNGGGVYVYSHYLVCTAAAGSGATFLLTNNWSDGVQSQTNNTFSQTFNAAGQISLGASVVFSQTFRLAPSLPFQYQVTLTPVSGGSATVSFYQRLTYLG